MISYLKNTEGYKMEFFKGKTYDQILPIFQARFDANMKFLFKTREEMEKKDKEIIKSINETPAQKAAKRRKLSEEAQEADDLKKRLEIVQDEDDDVFVEATPLAQKVLVVDYQIVVIDNKPKYKIIRADDTHQFYISFTTLLMNYDREDLETLWRIGKVKAVQDAVAVAHAKNGRTRIKGTSSSSGTSSLLRRKLFDTPSLVESISPEFNQLSKIKEHIEEEEVTMTETMEQYMSKTHRDYGSGVTRPSISKDTHFELKGQFLKELHDNTFSGSEHEDANEYIEKVLEIVDLFHIPKVTQDQFMLQAFPVSLTEAASRWLRNQSSGLITT
nr:hypothetical protein [Tanacetum cinerariifolium]